MTPNIPRIFAYVTAAFSLGMAVFIFTNLLYPFVQRPDWVGSASLIGFALIYGSLSLALGRRFIRKTNTHFWLPYAFVPFFVVPTMVASQLQGEFALIQDAIVFFIVITLGAVAGAWRGIKSGLVQREKLIEQIQQRREEMAASEARRS
jgi:ABC-type Fe3+-siderophore transport system permease subunit